ncbi:MAG: transketolase [Bacteroidetes bacterium]|nr:transketolase [Bacteroidota bacterium]
MKDITELKELASQTRRDIVRMVHAVQSGHPGGSLGCVEYFLALYHKIMEYKPDKFSMDGLNEDIFFLSNGHITPVYYSVLARAGYFQLSELHTFRKINSRLQGHPATHDGLEGVRIASGSLGQGLSVAIGAALSKKLNKDRQLVYALCGDGEINEGQIWEALMYAAAKQVDNIVLTVDCNGQQIDGSTKSVLDSGNLKEKFAAFGWQTHICENGNNIEVVISVLENAKNCTGKGMPQVILMHTEMGAGIDFMMGSHKWHGIAPNDEQLKQALDQLPSTLVDY